MLGLSPALSEREVRLARIRSQRLTGESADDVHSAVRDVFAIQAQETRAARLAVRPRSTSVDAAAVVRACNEERSVVRTWAMRGTLHMIAAEDVGWLIGLLRPPAGAVSRRQLELGLDERTLSRALPLIERILGASGPLTRAELVRRLADLGLRMDARSQAPAHLLFHAARQGLICRGPDRTDDEPTYVLLERWVGKQSRLPTEAAAAELARRYVRAYGPVGVADFRYWAGVPSALARRGLELVADEFEEVSAGGARAWVEPSARLESLEHDEACVRLLPRYDAYLLGYRSRELALDARFARRIQAGGGIIHPSVMVDGRVVGTWRQQPRRTHLVVEVEAFERLDRRVTLELGKEVTDLGRFLGMEAALSLAQS